MTRKDYVRIAQALKMSRPQVHEGRNIEYSRWFQSVLRLADALQDDNPRFNRSRFYVAAGVSQG